VTIASIVVQITGNPHPTPYGCLSNAESNGVTSGKYAVRCRRACYLSTPVQLTALSKKQRVTLPIVSFASNPLVALLCTAALRVDGWCIEVSCVLCLHFLLNRLISSLVVVLRQSCWQ